MPIERVMQQLLFSTDLATNSTPQIHSGEALVMKTIWNLEHRRLTISLALLAVCSLPATGPAAEVEGFTEPLRNIMVAAHEPGTILKADAIEGQHVQKGQVLAELDQSVLSASLVIAKAQMEARGVLMSAEAEWRLKSDRLQKLQALRGDDHASQEEVERAAAEAAIAAARIRTSKEALQVRELEFERIKAQIELRLVRSPIDGVITEIYKDVGEYVAPTDPIVLNVVQLDQLLAVFSVPSHLALGLKPKQSARVRIAKSKTAANGTIEFISPVTNAQSGTVKIKVRIPNVEGLYRSGEKCTLLLPGEQQRLTQKD